MENRTQPRHSFVVRIWWETGLRWRGWVQHAGSQETTYVQSLAELLAFIQAWTGELGEGNPPCTPKRP
jgi:hypothetical protein